MRKGLWSVVLAGGAMALAGCGSPRPMRYYTLEAPATNMHSEEATYPVSLLVGNLSAPHVLRDDRIAYGMTDVEMGLYWEHRWTEPPPEMLETMLVQKLRASGQYKTVQRISSSARGDYILRAARNPLHRFVLAGSPQLLHQHRLQHFRRRLRPAMLPIKSHLHVGHSVSDAVVPQHVGRAQIPDQQRHRICRLFRVHVRGRRFQRVIPHRPRRPASRQRHRAARQHYAPQSFAHLLTSSLLFLHLFARHPPLRSRRS